MGQSVIRFFQQHTRLYVQQLSSCYTVPLSDLAAAVVVAGGEKAADDEAEDEEDEADDDHGGGGQREATAGTAASQGNLYLHIYTLNISLISLFFIFPP